MGKSAPASSHNIFRFNGFEADRECYQLRSGSRTIRLERIPLELLFLLLENTGKLVAREQIASKLWQDDSFLDTERSINTAVRKIRKALGDDPHHPKFIETVIGKGYRFVTPVLSQTEDPAIPESPTPIVRGNRDSHEIRLQDFRIENSCEVPVLTCAVSIGGLALGRVPIAAVELPDNMSLPLRPEHRFMLQLHGVRISLTEKAVQVLHAVSISVLQSGLRTRAADSSPINSQVHLCRPEVTEPPETVSDSDLT